MPDRRHGRLAIPLPRPVRPPDPPGTPDGAVLVVGALCLLLLSLLVAHG